MFCHKCGNKSPNESTFCPKCGISLHTDGADVSVSDSLYVETLSDDVKYNVVLTSVSAGELTQKTISAVHEIILKDEMDKLDEKMEGIDKKIEEKVEEDETELTEYEMEIYLSGGLSLNADDTEEMRNETYKKACSLVNRMPSTIIKATTREKAMSIKMQLSMLQATVVIKYCIKCGGVLDSSSARCINCGESSVALPSEEPITHLSTYQHSSLAQSPSGDSYSGYDGIQCTSCKSVKIQTTVETKVTGQGGGYRKGKGCLGWLILGPLGLLCGLCGTETKVSSTNETFFICLSCGNKFTDTEWRGFQNQQNTIKHFNTVGINNSPLLFVEDAKKIGNNKESIKGTTGNQANNGFVAHFGDYLYYVIEHGDNRVIMRETASGSKEMVFNAGDFKEIRDLFADKNNLYFIADTSSKMFSVNTCIHSIPHIGTGVKQLSASKVIHQFCYGEHIYYINRGDNSSIYRMRTDGSEEKKIIAEKTKCLIVYNDKIYFHSNLIKCTDLDGNNVRNVLDKKVWNAYFQISDNILYYGTWSGLNEMICCVDLTTQATSSVLDAKNIADIKGYNVLSGNIIGNENKEGMYRWLRYNPSTNETAKYDNVTCSAGDKATTNIINGMVYFGNQEGVHGRIPIDGGEYERLRFF